MNFSASTGNGGTALLRRLVWLRLVAVGLLMPGLTIWTSPVRANPHGGSVVHGDIHIGTGTGGHLQIQQSSANAIINWDSFSIAAGELTQFLQPGASSAVLNRVTGGDPSAIHGALQANGNVFVINPNGILVGPSGTIDVHGLVLSTLDVSDGEFLAGGDQVFKGASDQGVTNLGRINAIGGDVFLIGKTVTNSGSITASGRVGLAAGEEVLLTAAESASGERIFVRATGSGVSGTGITNDGSIEGAAVEMKAHGNIYALAINNKGTVRATGASHSGGRVYLRGIGGGVSNSGSIRATSSGSGNAGRVLIEAAYAKVDGMMRAEGGDVRISATERVELGGTVDVSSSDSVGGVIVVEGPEIAVGSTAEVDASGIEGGNVRIGGGFQGKDTAVANAESLVVESGARILANGADGDAGTVILWSDDSTRFSGEIRAEAGGSGHGGFVEVSGKETLRFEGLVSTLAESGQNGTLLLDPTDFAVIVGGAGAGGVNEISNADLITQLGLGNVVIATDSDGSEDGTITVETGADVFWSTGNSLALLAHGDILFNASVQTSGVSGVTAVAGWNGTTGFGGGAGVTQPGSVNFAEFVADPASYGNVSGTATGTIHVGDGSQTAGIAVGSREGVTYLAGQGVEVRGGTASSGHAQIGYHTDLDGDNVTGSITVEAKEGGVLVQGGTSYAQIGHGGLISSTPPVANLKTLVGAITVRADRGATVGDVRVLAGTGGSNGYAQIGQGGRRNWGNHSGQVVVIGNEIEVLSRSSYAQIGHGGNYGNHSTGTYDGNIFLNFDPDANGGLGAAAGGGGALSITAQSGFDHYAQIGHGGVVAQGASRTGDITVGAAASLSLQGGANKSAYAQLGHGGVSSGNGTMDGHIHVTTAGDVSVRGGTGASTYASAYAQIGHGGTGATGAKSGSITINSLGSAITVAGGTNTGVTRGYYAMIGHGGDLNGGSAVGDIVLNALQASLAVTAGEQERNFARIGHGGFNPGETKAGNISLSLGGDITLNGGGLDSYAQIGHGGRGAGGATSGQVTVLAYDGSAYKDILLKGGGGTDAYAQIGHGGSHNLASHGAAGDFIQVDGASVTVEGGGGQRSYAQIGMGGATSVAGSHEGTLIGDVNVNQNGGGSGAVEVKGGAGVEAYAQIGIGGNAWDGNKTGSTRVTGTEVRLTSRGSAAHALIGAGGGILSNATDFPSGTITGATWVTATNGGVTLDARNGGSQAFTQIGMGGLLHDGIFNGLLPVSTTVSATGAITLQGGGNSNTYAQIGAGGAGGGLGSDIGHRYNAGVSVTGASLSLLAGSGNSSYAQIGSSGGRTGAGSNRSEGDVEGEIIVEATSGDVTLTGGTGRYSYAQIGHGGSLVSGDLSGNVRVWASGSVTLTGRTGAEGYAQIGHGGDSSSGAMAGDVRVAALSGDLALTGGTGALAYAMTGHGARTGSSGTRQGGIHLFADGALDAGTGTRLFHQTGSGLAAANYLGGDGVQLIGNGDLDFADDALTGVGTMVNGNLGSGPVQVAFSNDIDLLLEGADVAVDEATHFYLLSGGDITVRRSYQNAGTGGVWLGAGWDGDMDVLGNGTADTSSPGGPFLTGAALDFNGCAFGANGGSLLVGVTGQTSAVRVGSRAGANLFAGDAVTLTAGAANAAAHLGFYGAGSDAITGAIGVRVGAGGLELQGGSLGAYAQIGHGGFGSAGLDVTSAATIDISFCEPGTATLQGGTSSNAYAQIGHGGVQTGTNTRRGDVTVTGFQGLTVIGGNTTGAYAQIGNGGHVNTGSIISHTTVTGTGLITLGSTASKTNAQIGAGGSGAQGTKTGNVTVTGGGFILRGGTSSAQIGNGGAFLSRFATGTVGGTVTVTANGAGMTGPDAGSIHMAGGDTTQSYVQIGNGGLVADGNITGPTIVNASGTLTMSGGAGDNTYAQIGIGGAGVNGNMDGAVDVTAASIRMTSGSGRATYAQIGQGGGATGASDGNQRFGAINGDVTVNTTAGGIDMNSAGSAATVRNFVQIGAGGGGAGISNGGSGNSVTSITTVNTVGGGLSMNATNADYVQIGAGGRGFTSSGITGAVNLDIDGAVDLTGGDLADRYVQIGHGGTRSVGAMNGAVNVFAAGSIALNGGAIDDTYAQIGHGGQYSAGVKNGAIHVTAGTSLTQTGAGLHSHTRIGHGGLRSADDASGAIKVSVTGGDLVLRGGTAHYAYSQIGHGASFDIVGSGESSGVSGVTYDGDICVDVSGKVEMLAQAGGGNGAHAQIGHGGRRVTGVFSGDVTVTAGWDAGATDTGITLQGLTTSSKFAQIGHGGVHSHGTMTGDIRVAALNGGDITLEGNPGWEHSYAMIGHGASSSLNSGTRQGGIHLFADGDISATGTNVSVTHLSGGVFQDSHYLAGAGSGYQLIANGTATYDDMALRGASAMVNGNFASGNIAVAFSNAIDIAVGANQHSGVNTTDGFHILTGGNITMLSGYQNAGSGDVTLVAGWNGVGSVSGGVTFNGAGYCDPVMSAGGVTVDFTNCAVTGNNGKTVTLGATNQTGAVRVGSREGVTSVAGYGLILNAGTADAATHLGFYGDGSGDASGAIDIRLKEGGLRLHSGATRAYTQIGHGGLGSVSGHTTAAATIAISFCEPGEVVLNGGSGTDAYAQIGHGGVRAGTHNRFGNVSVTGFDSLSLVSGGSYAYTQIGNGGFDTDGTIVSNVAVVGTGAVSLLSGGTRGYAHIGSGGAGSDGDKTGLVTVEGDSVSLDANTGDHAYAQIGLGGGFTSTDFSNGILSGDVSVTATSGGVSLTGGAAAQSYTQIGHGGLVANVRESGSIVSGEAISGKTTVTAAGALTMTGSTGGNAYVQIGAGGAGLDGHIADADVEVTAESVTMTARNGAAAYVQIGSGGGATSSGTNTRTGAVSGNVSVTTTGGGVAMASAAAGARSYVQIGAGGGGYLDAGANGGAGRSLIGNTTVTTVGGGLTMDSGLASYVQIGAGGVNVDVAEITGGTTVNVDGDIELRGGSAADRYAMIGLGGSQSDAVVDGLVSVEASGKIELFGGSGADAFAQIGHGGRSTTGGTTGEVSVISGGILDLTGGGAGSHAQIGHGGFQSSGAVVGAVEVRSVGDLSLGAGTGTWSHTRIGHGGRLNTGDKTGSVKVSVSDGDLLLQGNNPQYAYAQIGHGATFETNTAVNADGVICVDVGGKISLGVTTGSGGPGGHAQIGHGARRMDGSHVGDVTVVSGTNAALGGGIDLRGAVTGSASRFAQIGHGGVYSAGAMSGDISVVALNGGSVTLVGGTQQQYSAAMIGHGESGGLSSGTRQGGIHIFADDKIETIGDYTSVTHLSGMGLSAANYLGGNGFQLVANGGSSFRNQADTADSDAALRGLQTMLDKTFGTGPVNFAFTNAIDIVIGANQHRSVNTADGFHILTGGNITMLSGYQNAGSGDVTLVAGWNGSGSVAGGVTFNGAGYCDPVISAGGVTVDFTNCAVTGNNGKTVTLGATNQTSAVRVGSREGVTSVAGHGLTLHASTAATNAGTQLGFYSDGSGDASGSIDVRLKTGGLALRSGSQSGAHTQIGHGGLDSTAGNTTATATISISFCEPGDVILNGSTGVSAYAQIGHGGRSTGGTRNGAISLTGFHHLDLNGGSNSNYGYAQIGHGGAGANFGSVTGAAITLSGSGNATIDGGGTYTHAMIGHGGNGASGVATDSGIFLDMVGGIALTGGSTQESAAQIGHGGHNALNLKAVDSLIRINEAAGTGTGDVMVLAGGTNTYAMIGHGGSRTDGNIGSGDNSASGAIEILRSSNVRVRGGSNTDGVAQIGHGGERSPGSQSGAITVKTAGEIEVRGGTAGNYAIGKIGHGGVMHRGSVAGAPGGDKSGDISLEAGGAITVAAGTGAHAAAQVGHGGHQSLADFDGAVTLNAGGDIVLTGGTGLQASTQVGHGGFLSEGERSGAVTLNAGGEIRVTAGASGQDNYAQVGHGGRTTAGDATGAVLVEAAGNVTVTAGLGTSGNERYAQIGHGGIQGNAGDHVGAVTVRSGGDILLQGGTAQNAYVQIGNGGRQAKGDHSGDIVMEAAGSITGQAGTSATRTGVLVGHGGSDAASGSGTGNRGDIFVNAAGGAVNFTGGGGEDGQARIGHGGPLTGGNHDGRIVVLGRDGIALTAGNGNRALAQIGHGGGAVSGHLSGDIFLNIDPLTFQPAGGGPIALLGGSGAGGAYAQVGHGGLSASGNTSGSIVAFSSAGMSLRGGATDAYAMLGHGGRSHTGNHGTAGDLVVAVAMDGVELLGGTGTRSFVQIGHGGNGSHGTLTGDVLVNFNPLTGTPFGGGHIEVRGGSGTEAFAQIGLGGVLNGSQVGSTVVHGESVALQVGSGTIAYSRIGAGGGVNNIAAVTGSTTVQATGGGVSVNAANGGGNAYAQIGAGGLGGEGAIVSGATSVVATGAVELVAGGGTNASAVIGAGGAGRDGNKDAAVDVSGASITLQAGGSAAAYAQIGSGGGITNSSNASSGHVSGAVSVAATSGDVILDAAGHRSYAQIGHGGLDFSGNVAGDLHLVSTGDLLVDGGTTANAYAMVGHGGITEAAAYAGGTRRGDVLLRVTGTTRLADNASTSFLGHLGAGGTVAASRFALVTAYLDVAASALGMVGDMLNGGSVEIGVTQGDLSYRGFTPGFHSAHHMDLFAAGDVEILGLVQNGGAGDINVVAGWDGTTGLVENVHPGVLPFIDELRLDAAAVSGDASAWGNGGGSVRLGDGTQTSAVAVGSAGGATNVWSDGLALRGSDTTMGGSAQIGYRSAGVSGVGDIAIAFKSGDVLLQGGAAAGTYVHIGHSGMGGDHSGAISLQTGAPFDLSLLAGDGVNAYAQIGHGGPSHQGSASGDLAISPLGALVLAGGDTNAYAQIGHGGVHSGSTGSSRGGVIDLRTESVSLRGGDGLLSYAQIGHGGGGAKGTDFDGAVSVVANQGIEILGGVGGAAYAQIGHGGAMAHADMGGAVTVEAGADIAVRSMNLATIGYAKIGHGDDLRGSFATYAGTGLRDGAVQISADGDIALEGAQIGHVGSSSPAVSGAGATTWLAVSKDAPSDPSGGSLLADAATEFGGSEVRFYLPRRGNNGVAAGAWINGTPYDGGVGDPWPVQRADEYTRYIETAGGLLEPADHNSIPGDGPAPVTAGAYAFYYDTIVQGGTLPPLFPPLPPTSSPLFPGPSGPPPASDPDHASSFPDDRTLNDWLKELEERYSGPGEFSILYEGYDHYGPNGESIYHFPGLSEP